MPNSARTNLPTGIIGLRSFRNYTVYFWRRKELLRGIFRTKNLDDILAALGDEKHSLKRTLGPLNITLLGIGAIIGAGIFATIGAAAAGDSARPGAGPSLMLSLVITAVVCGFTALCYAAFASERLLAPKRRPLPQKAI